MARLAVSVARIGLFCVGLSLATPTVAKDIERACLKSDRAAGNRAICGCIQDAANLTLTNKDQRLAATFFADPHRAQEIRQSDRRQHEAFWERYKNFGITAESYCQH
ncbi:MAG: hypothetical protein ACR2OY_09885 [Boseongicola sp.]